MGLVTQTRNLRHPARPVLTEELCLWWQLFRVIQRAVRDVPELKGSLFLLWSFNQLIVSDFATAEVRAMDTYSVFTRE